MANIGSEVERAIRAHERGNPGDFDLALDRALELFDLTIGDPRWRNHWLREITRAREEFCALFFGDPDRFSSSAPGLKSYFLYFAIAARSPPTGRAPLAR